MQAEHISSDRLAAYRARRLSSGELLSVTDHLAACDVCRSQLEPEEHLHAAFQSVRDALQPGLEGDEEHIRYRQLSGYLSGAIDPAERELVQMHLDGCDI